MSGVDRFEDLLTWQLMFELSVEVWELTASPPASRDFDYRDQIRDSSDSAQRNVAEGFGRFNPTEFLRFLDIVKASADETRALLTKGHRVGYLSDEQFAACYGLSTRGLQAMARLRRYLRTPQARRNAARIRERLGREGLARKLNIPSPGKYVRDRRVPNATNGRNAPNDGNGPNDPNDSNAVNDPNDSNVPNDPNDV